MKTLRSRRNIQSKITGQILLLLLAALWILIGLSSCTIEKRLYRPGLHIELKKIKLVVKKSEYPKQEDNRASSMGFIAIQPVPAPSSVVSNIQPKNVLTNNSYGATQPTKNKHRAVLNKSTSKAEIEIDPQESKAIKQERNNRIVQHSLLGIAVLLFTYFEVWIPAVALCLLLLLLIHCRPDLQTVVRKRALRKASSPVPDTETNVGHTIKPQSEYYAGKKTVHVAAVLSLPFIFFPPLSFIGIILSATALSDIKNQPTRYKGKVAAQIGLVFNIIWTVLILAFLIAVLVAISL